MCFYLYIYKRDFCLFVGNTVTLGKTQYMLTPDLEMVEAVRYKGCPYVTNVPCRSLNAMMSPASGSLFGMMSPGIGWSCSHARGH